jgi:hypothetical protein
MTDQPATRFNQPIRGLEDRAINLGKAIKREMDTAGIYCRLDDTTIGLLSLFMARLEAVQDMGLDFDKQISHELKITATIIRLRSQLGLSKEAQEKREATARGPGRPSNSDTWSGIDI